MSSHSRKAHAKRRLDDLIRRFAHPLEGSRQAFWRLIHVVRAASDLLVPLPERGRTDPRFAERIIRACVRMSHHSHAWRQLPETWDAPSAGQFLQFRSLVSHLFDQYPVPKFMVPVWMGGHDKTWELDMYLHLAAGKSVRHYKLPSPFRMSKRTAAFFMQAPDDLRPLAAIRWAQVRSLGGDNRLARLFAKRTVLATLTEHEAFWESVFRFFVNNDPICADEMIAIVRFIHEQRFQPAETVWGPGAGEQPLQPCFTIKGRSLRSLRRHMVNWRTDLLAKLPPPAAETPCWKRTAIGPLRYAEGDLLWTIDELLSDKELRVEGGIMRHCVATYIHDCGRRRTSIWSLKMHYDEHRKRLLTIEVDPKTRTIWQAKGRRNSPPTEKAIELLQRWAEQEELQFREMA